jgi:transcriptional regulator with XRE-family HTH domain
MHDFYKRMQTVFQQAGSNRNQFCRKRGHKYQTLQAYWNTDRLPSGDVLEDLAKEYNVSLDTLVLGGSAPGAHEENSIVDRIVRSVKRLDEVSLLRVDGALQMFQYLLRSGSLAAEPAGEAASAAGGSGAAGAALVGGQLRADLEFMPPKMEQATELLGELSRLIHRSGMADRDKTAARAMLQQIVLDIYQREVKDEWAELEEVE